MCLHSPQSPACGCVLRSNTLTSARRGLQQQKSVLHCCCRVIFTLAGSTVQQRCAQRRVPSPPLLAWPSGCALASSRAVKRVHVELCCSSEQVQDMPALPHAAERPRSRNGFVELFKEEDVHLGWVTVRKTVLTCFLQSSCLPPPLPLWLPF